MNKSLKIVIPARRNSKGLPFKNRILIKKLLDIIPFEYQKDVLVSTDDEFIIDLCNKLNLQVRVRPENISLDTTSTKEVIEDLVDNGFLDPNADVIMLYTTYPERSWKDVTSAYDYFFLNNCKSLLTKYDIAGVHPFLMAFEDGCFGKQIFKHDLYRRQDYPKVFEISHYICIFKVSELKNLNKNLYNEETHFYKLEKKIDVDRKEDLENYERIYKNNS